MGVEALPSVLVSYDKYIKMWEDRSDPVLGLDPAEFTKIYKCRDEKRYYNDQVTLYFDSEADRTFFVLRWM